MGFPDYNYTAGSIINVGYADEDGSEFPAAIAVVDFNAREQAERFLEVCEENGVFPYVRDFIDWLCETGLCKKIAKNEYIFLPFNEEDFGWFGLVSYEELEKLQAKYFKDEDDKDDDKGVY